MVRLRCEDDEGAADCGQQLTGPEPAAPLAEDDRGVVVQPPTPVDWAAGARATEPPSPLTAIPTTTASSESRVLIAPGVLAPGIGGG